MADSVDDSALDAVIDTHTQLRSDADWLVEAVNAADPDHPVVYHAGGRAPSQQVRRNWAHIVDELGPDTSIEVSTTAPGDRGSAGTTATISAINRDSKQRVDAEQMVPRLAQLLTAFPQPVLFTFRVGDYSAPPADARTVVVTIGGCTPLDAADIGAPDLLQTGLRRRYEHC